MADLITYTDKEQGQVNTNPVEKTFTFGDANEIKTVVNSHATDIETNATNIATNLTSISGKADKATLTQSGGNITGSISTDTNTFTLTSSGAGSSLPQIPISMLSSSDNDFFIVASCIAKASNAYVNNDPITWELLAPDTSHEYSFFTGAAGNISNNLDVSYPNVKNVLQFQCQSDESIVRLGANYGSTVGINSAEIRAFIPLNPTARLTGNGTTTWVKNGGASGQMTVEAVNVNGLTKITYAGFISNIEGNGVTVSYQGDNNYRVERLWSALGTATIGFYLVDIDTNTRITTAPTSVDDVIVSGGGLYTAQLNLENYTAGPIGRNELLSGNNLWIFGLFELWFKAITVSDTEVKCIWQPKSGVTTYNLYRDINEDLSTKTLIYSGSLLEFDDSGLTADTIYYYELEDQTNTEISRFNTKTKA